MKNKSTSAILKWIVFSSAIVLSACQSVGVQYQQPTHEEPSAVLNGSNYFVNTFRDDGCYAGRTHVEEAGYKIHANQPILINVEGEMQAGEFCRVSVSFIPEAGREYNIAAKFSRKFRENALIPVSKGVCSLGVNRIEADGSVVPFPVLPARLGMSRGFCLKNRGK